MDIDLKDCFPVIGMIASAIVIFMIASSIADSTVCERLKESCKNPISEECLYLKKHAGNCKENVLSR